MMKCLVCESAEYEEKVLPFVCDWQGMELVVQTEALKCPQCESVVMTAQQKAKEMKLFKAKAAKLGLRI